MQFFKRLAHKNETVEHGALRKMYAALVNQKIRARYKQDEVEAIMRKAINGDRAEFDVYNAFAEQCKAEARKELGIKEE